jgi:hypothetical protein
MRKRRSEAAMRAAILLIICGMAVLLPSCTRPKPAAAKPTIVGKWQSPTSTDAFIEFKPDGSVTMAGPLKTEVLQYRMLGDMAFEMSRPGQKWVRWTIAKLTDDELELVGPDGFKHTPARRMK